METTETAAISWIANLMNAEIYNGQSLSDYLSLDVMLSVGGSFIGAIAILVLGFLFANFLGRRVRAEGLKH